MGLKETTTTSNFPGRDVPWKWKEEPDDPEKRKSLTIKDEVRDTVSEALLMGRPSQSVFSHLAERLAMHQPVRKRKDNDCLK